MTKQRQIRRQRNNRLRHRSNRSLSILHPRIVGVEPLEDRLLLTGNDAVDVGTCSYDSTIPVVNQRVWEAPSSSWRIGRLDSAPEGEDALAQDLVAFAKALAQTTGVKFYAASWCPACNSQKALFEDGADFLPFIEVTNPDRSLNAVGTAANITSYPTWEFPDGTRATGVLSLATIAQRSGVAIPTGVNPTIAPIADQTVLGGSPLHVALNGYDPNGGTLTYTVTSSNPSLVQATVLSGNRSAKVAVEGWGDMVFQLFESDVPGATGRFITLAQAGFYDSANNSTPIKMHRVIDNFMFQFGDPTGTGTSGSTLGTFDDDFDAKLQHNTTGVLSWAKSDDDTNNSQVFVTDTATRWLDFNHSVFGQLVEGDKVRNAINGTAVSGSTPVFNINISTVSIFNDTENGLLRLVAAEGATGTADITVTVTDSAGHQFAEVFTVNVSPDSTNNLPFLADIPVIRTTVNTPATFTLSAVDLEGNAVKFAGLKSGSVNYTFTVNSTTGEVTVTPPTGFVGTMQLLVGVKAATDSSTALTADSASSTVYDKQLVTLQVGPAAPTAVDLQAASDSGYLNTDNLTRTNSLSFDVLGVTSGAVVKLYRGTTLLGSATASGSMVTITTTGLASLGDGTYNITGTQTENGLESFASPVLVVTLDTTAPPLFTSIPPTTAAVGVQLSYNVQNAEEGAPGTVYSLVNAPTGVTINTSTGVVSWTPTAAQFGVHAFSVVLTDGAGNSRTQDLSIEVTSDALLGIRLDTTNASGSHLSTVDVGTEFLLKVFVEDLRSQPQGVFGAVLDVLYNQQLVSVIGPVTFGSDYSASQQHDISTAGIINETGAYAGSLSPLGGGERLLFSVLVRATKSGTVVFTADPPDGVSAQDPDPEILLYGEDLNVAMDDIQFGMTSLIVNQVAVSSPVLQLRTSSVEVSGVTPGGLVTFVRGTQLGNTYLSMFGVTVGISNPVVVAQGIADKTGHALAFVNPLPNASGQTVYYQAFEQMPHRQVSNVVSALQPLRAETGQGTGGMAITREAIPGLLTAAIQRWTDSGLRTEQLEWLRAVSVGIEELPAGMLAYATDRNIVLDITGAGHGWFVDTSAADDREFGANLLGGFQLAATEDIAIGKVDALTVIMHEIGHILGMPDNGARSASSPLMNGTLATGQRAIPVRHTNLVRPNDVNGDQAVTPLDALTIINTLNRNTRGWPYADFGLGTSRRVFLDTNQDFYISPSDALRVINELNLRRGGDGEGESESGMMKKSAASSSGQVAYDNFVGLVGDIDRRKLRPNWFAEVSGDSIGSGPAHDTTPDLLGPQDAVPGVGQELPVPGNLVAESASRRLQADKVPDEESVTTDVELTDAVFRCWWSKD